MIIEVTSRELLAEFLRRSGRPFPGDCGGSRGCGKCTVKLLSGIWESGGKLLTAPCPAVPCVTRLKSCIGAVEIPETPPEVPEVVSLWEHTSRELPDSPPVIAVDIGTTTLAAVRLEGGRITGQAASFNGQCVFGDNVMTRIARAGTPASFGELRKALLDSVGGLLKELDWGSCRRIAVAGNTVMSCFLHGVDPSPIGVAPFSAPEVRFPERRDLWGDIPVFTVPCLTGLLGGDIAAGLHEAPLEEGEMFIDLGTNCEIVFRTAGGLFGSSAAAGPAFEGAGITCGSRAAAGAVDHWYGAGRYSVIGGGPARFVCGSGLLDILAVERASGALNAAGRFVSGASRMAVAPGVTVSEKDIAELLKAKAAVGSAVKALELYAGSPVRQLKLAGGFSRRLDPGSARRIGLLPDLPAVFCGNLSLAGAARLAADPSCLPEMAAPGNELREVHLNDLPGFAGLFTRALRLP